MWFLLVRLLPNTRCQCFDRYEKTSDYWCPICLGTGHRIRLEKVPVRRTAGYREELDLVPIGYVSQTHPVIYTPYWLRPRDNDLFIEVNEWREVRPVDVFRVYRVMIALPMKQREISYYACGCNPADFDRERLLDALKDKTIIERTRDGMIR